MINTFDIIDFRSMIKLIAEVGASIFIIVKIVKNLVKTEPERII